MNFAAIDFETAKNSPESACSIGLVKFIEGKEAEVFYSLIRPPTLYIRPDFTRIHGLTVDDVKDAPVFADIWEDVMQFVGNLPLAAHYAPFDMGVLRAVLGHYRLKTPKQKYFCTCELSRRTWKELRSHSLTNLAKHFNIIYDAHNALEDARTCGKLALMSAEVFNCKDVPQLLKTVKMRFKTL